VGGCGCTLFGEEDFGKQRRRREALLFVKVAAAQLLEEFEGLGTQFLVALDKGEDDRRRGLERRGLKGGSRVGSNCQALFNVRGGHGRYHGTVHRVYGSATTRPGTTR
jgi:hypothetical protein